MSIILYVEPYMNYFSIIPEKKQYQHLITIELYQHIFNYLDSYYVDDIMRFRSKIDKLDYYINKQKCLIYFSKFN
jgi:hypothetical protein